MSFDMQRVYSYRIWQLYKDVCKEDLVMTIAVIRACQLGVAGVTQDVLDEAIDNRGRGIDLDAVMAAVKEQLPNFNPDLDAVPVGIEGN